MGNLLGAPITDKETHVGTTSCQVEYGVSSMQGWRIHMEDAHICEPRLYALESSSNKIDLPGHSLFAVFDGHGGSFAAEFAGKNLCRVLSRQGKFVEYAKFVQTRAEKEAALESAAERAKYVRSGLELLERALRDAFVELDCEIMQSLDGEDLPEANTPYHEEDVIDSKMEANSNDTKDATMQDGGQGNSDNPAASSMEDQPELDSGTTAVVVILTPQWVVCANAGDSRAVFSKGGHKAVPLSYDHKPDDEEEELRIRTAGGYVAGGRVQGDLAVSRGLGDFRFKVPRVVLAGNSPAPPDNSNETSSKEKAVMEPDDQMVSPIPDIIVQNRNTEHDEFVIVACDGVWDVQTNYEAVRTVSSIFAEGESNVGLVCEEVLDLCLRMGSKDNMTALVLKFEAEKIGEGGGVKARRQLRDAAENEPEDDDAEEKVEVTEN